MDQTKAFETTELIKKKAMGFRGAYVVNSFLGLLHDQGSNYLSDGFQLEIRSFGIESLFS